MNQPTILPVTDNQVQTIRHGFLTAITGKGLDPIPFWQAFPELKKAIDTLPDLELWKSLPEDFRFMLVPQMQINGMDLPEDFLRKHQWLLDLRSGYDYGFEIDRRKLPRKKA